MYEGNKSKNSKFPTIRPTVLKFSIQNSCLVFQRYLGLRCHGIQRTGENSYLCIFHFSNVSFDFSFEDHALDHLRTMNPWPL